MGQVRREHLDGDPAVEVPVVARYTTAIPPRPISWSIRKRSGSLIGSGDVMALVSSDSGRSG
jgi:hypothetical protein